MSITPAEVMTLYERADGPGFLNILARRQLADAGYSWPRPVDVPEIESGGYSIEVQRVIDFGLVLVGEGDVFRLNGASVSITHGIASLYFRDNKEGSAPFFFQTISESEGARTAYIFASPQWVLAWCQSGTEYHASYPHPWLMNDVPSVFQMPERIYRPDRSKLQAAGMTIAGVEHARRFKTMTEIICLAQGSEKIVVRPDECEVIVDVSGLEKSLETKGGARVDAIIFGLSSTRLMPADDRKRPLSSARLRAPQDVDTYDYAVERCKQMLLAEAACRHVRISRQESAQT